MEIDYEIIVPSVITLLSFYMVIRIVILCKCSKRHRFLYLDCVVFTTLGVVCYVLGCDSNIKNSCINYDLVTATLIDNYYYIFECTVCIKYEKKCSRYNNGPRITCYTVCSETKNTTCTSTVLNYKYNNATCNITYSDKDFTPLIGMSTKLYVSTENGKCSLFLGNGAIISAYLGLICIVISFIVFVLACKFYCTTSKPAKNTPNRV